MSKNSIMKCLGFLLLLLVSLVHGAHLPKEFKTCKVSSPDVDKCLQVAVTDAIKKLAKGEQSLGIFSIEPLAVDKMEIPAGGGALKFSQKYTNFKLNGMSNVKLSDTHADFVKKTLHTKSFSPRLEVIGTYAFDGRVIVLPIVGNGKFNITLENCVNTHDLKAEEFEVKGKKYWKIIEFKEKIRPEKVYFHFDNLFNGDERLGKEMNSFMNENSKDIFAEMRGPFEESFGLIFESISNRVFTRVPIDEIFIK